MKHVLSADIGGTNIRLAIINSDGDILDETRQQAKLSQHQATSSNAAEKHVIQTLGQAFQSFLTASSYSIDAIGIGFPGFFHGETGILASSPNLPGLIDFPLAELLAQHVSKPVSVQNDALCAAIGEHRFGAGQDQNNLLHITLGTGVGAGLILHRQPYAGEHGMAMEFGHLCVERSSGAHPARLCGCGNYGCLETYASATAVVQHYAEISGSQANAQTIHQSACDGDETALHVLRQAGSYLGQGIAESIKLLDISTVSISGGLSGAWDILHPALMQSLDANLIPPLQGKVQVLRSTLADNAGLLGAAVIAR